MGSNRSAWCNVSFDSCDAFLYFPTAYVPGQKMTNPYKRTYNKDVPEVFSFWCRGCRAPLSKNSRVYFGPHARIKCLACGPFDVCEMAVIELEYQEDLAWLMNRELDSVKADGLKSDTVGTNETSGTQDSPEVPGIDQPRFRKSPSRRIREIEPQRRLAMAYLPAQAT